MRRYSGSRAERVRPARRGLDADVNRLQPRVEVDGDASLLPERVARRALDAAERRVQVDTGRRSVDEERPDADPDSERGIPVVIVAQWQAKELTGLTGYQVEALKTGRYGVHFINRIDGKPQKLNVLFPGEKSYRLDLSRVYAARKGQAETE